VMYPDITGETIGAILVGGTGFAVAGYAITALLRKGRATSPAVTAGAQVQNRQLRDTWRMPPLNELPAPQLTLSKRIWMAVLRGYLIIAVCLVIVKVVQMMMVP